MIHFDEAHRAVYRVKRLRLTRSNQVIRGVVISLELA